MTGTGKFVSRTALAVALTFGIAAGASLIPSPAEAAKKKKDDDGPKLEFSKGFVAIAGPAQTAINDAGKKSDVQAAQAQIDAAGNNEQQLATARSGMNAALASELGMLEQAFGAIENDSDRFLAGNLAYALGGAARDQSLQLRGLKTMLESGMTDPARVPQYSAVAGQLAYVSNDFATAQHYLQQAVNGGYTESNVEVLLAESYFADNKPGQGAAVLKSAISSRKASGTLAPDAWYRRGLISAYKAGLLNETADFGAMLITDYPQPANTGAAATILREIGAFGAQETLDLMRLMGRTNSYAEERDFVEYIQAADPRRLPGEVLNVISAGISSGRLNPADTFVADAKAQAGERAAGDRAGLSSYASDARKPNATVATVTGAADALLSYGEVAQAEELYNLAMTKGGSDEAQVLTRLGIALVDQGKFAAAQAAFGRVTGKRSAIAKLWAAYAAGKAASASPATASAE